MLLLRFLLEVVHLALGACLSTCIPTSPSLCSLSSSHPSPAPQAWPWWRTTPVRIDSIRQRGGHSSLVAPKAACAHQKAWSFSLEPRSSQQGLGQMRDGDTGMLVDKGLASWTRACQNGQGLVEMDKGLSTWTRACRARQGLVEMDKGLASWTRACRDGQGLVSKWTREKRHKGMPEATRA